MTLEERRGIETRVYQPAEDSALLANAVCDDLDRTGGSDRRREVEIDGSSPRDESSNNTRRVLDVGTGSGYVGLRLSGCDHLDVEVVASDVNPHAVRRAATEGLAVVRGDLVAPFVDSTFDVVVFNPPYLPTDPALEQDDWMERALSGGQDGRMVIDRFLDTVGRVLAPNGVVYLLVSSLTDVDAVVERAGDAGFSASGIADESFPFETLTVLKLFRGTAPS